MSYRTATPFIVLAGVPGAGKSTALRAVSGRAPGARILDPEQPRDWIAARTFTTPYRRYRWLVHTLHHLRTFWFLLLGPRRPLVVHEPGTRRRVRRALLNLARVRGWRPVLVFIDVSAEDATAGQRARSRMISRESFTAHWLRWSDVRHAASRGSMPNEDWTRVLVVPRSDAVDAVASQLDRTGMAAYAGRS